MRRKRRFWALLILSFSCLTPLAYFYYALKREGFENPLDSVRYENQHFKRIDFKTENGNISECENIGQKFVHLYPLCREKIEWFKNGKWGLHKCYAENGVDGTICSFRRYLSEVEHFCPLLNGTLPKTELCKPNVYLNDLLAKFTDVPETFHYIKNRISQNWESWINGINEANSNYSTSMNNRKIRRIIIFIGFMANEKKLKIGETSNTGGPLGEMLQWSDLITSLFILGHDVQITVSKTTIKKIIEESNFDTPCKSANEIDLIFTDIMGFHYLRKNQKKFLLMNICKFRLLDSFGTHAEFSSAKYFMQNRKQITGKNAWGGLGLDLRQHWTFFPHSHDNTFLGFVIQKGNSNEIKKDPKTPKALIYGKDKSMWENAQVPISILKEEGIEIHATVANANESLPIFQNIINHGFLSSENVLKLLDHVQIFVGLGFPIEGPAPLEAIAHGAVFINAKFNEPKFRKNYKFFADKPTLRKLTSQSPYLERLGEPHVITVDIQNAEELRRAIRRALELRPEPKVTEEFTPKGMLLRLGLLIEKQNLCGETDGERWPPIDAMEIVRAVMGESCEEACMKNDLMCEPSFFIDVNQRNVVGRNSQSSCLFGMNSTSSPLAPYQCTLQSTSSLFSCASKPDDLNIHRICPCRDHLPEQHAICKKCIF